MSYDIVIKNGTLVTASSTYQADLAITGERVVAIGERLTGRTEIDATGKLVLPGAVDIHVHFQMPFPGNVVTVDDFLVGTQAAACGGTTTTVDFVHAEPHQSLLEALELELEEVGAVVLRGHGGVCDPLGLEPLPVWLVWHAAARDVRRAVTTHGVGEAKLVCVLHAVDSWPTTAFV